MKKESYKLIAIRDSGVFVVYPASMPGLVVQVKELKDAPAQLAKLMESLFQYALEHGNFEISISK